MRSFRYRRDCLRRNANISSQQITSKQVRKPPAFSCFSRQLSEIASLVSCRKEPGFRPCCSQQIVQMADGLGAAADREDRQHSPQDNRGRCSSECIPRRRKMAGVQFPSRAASRGGRTSHEELCFGRCSRRVDVNGRRNANHPDDDGRRACHGSDRAGDTHQDQV